jgi:hypothetical protein
MNYMRTIGSRKISGTSNSDAYAPQRTTVPEPLRSLVAGAPSGSRFQLSLLIRLWRGNSARLIDARPCVAGRLARFPRRSRTEDKMASRPLSSNKRCPGTTWAVAPPADSRAHLFDASLRASGCRLPQTIAETRVPIVRRPSSRRRVAQPGLSRRTGRGQTMGDAILSPNR